MSDENLKPERQFKGIWIPAAIWLHPKLLPLEKILWAEIDSFSKNETGWPGHYGCWASNEYFSKFLGVSERYVSEMVAKLEGMRLISRSGSNGRSRFLKSSLRSRGGGTVVQGRPELWFHLYLSL